MGSDDLEEGALDIGIDEDEKDDSITTEEIRMAIGQMKRRKLTGEDGMPLEILVAGGEIVIQKMLEICQMAYETERAPADWKRGVISLLLKKGEKTVCDNHRGITLLSYAENICIRVLEKFI